tara:strand:- start:7234 stop:8790 length:1557 start_codon:yes stop_codon:yes gene_type:complete
MLVAYAASFYSGSLWDDNVFIFKAKAITETSHPFVFFDYTSSNHRAWPLGYVFFWLLYRVFAENFIWYKLLNLLVHFLNFHLLRKFLFKFKIRNSFFISLLFLFHPLQVESVSWIFQLNTLLATTFVLLSFNLILQNKYKLSILFFIFSLLTKSYAVFAPFVFLLLFIPKYPIKRSILKSIPFFAISLIVGLLTIRGVLTSEKEGQLRDKFHTEKAQKIIKEETIVVVPSPEPIDEVEVVLTDTPTVATEQEIPLEESSAITEPVPTETSPTPKAEKTIVVVRDKKVIDLAALAHSKLQLMANSFVFYLHSFFIGSDHFLFYPMINESSNQNIYNMFIFFIIATTYVFFLFDPKYNKSKTFIIATLLFCSWLPISGIFYVPFMKFAHYSDHWAYLSTIPLSILLMSFIDAFISKFKLRAKMSSHMVGLIFVIPISYNLIKTIQYSSIFNDHEVMLRRNIVHNPENMFVRRYLAAKLHRNGETQYAIDELLKAQSIEPLNMEVKVQLDYYKEKLEKERE